MPPAAPWGVSGGGRTITVRTAGSALGAVIAFVVLLAVPPAAPPSPLVQCGIESTQPLWVDYGDRYVPFRRLFRRPGLVVAVSKPETAREMSRGGARPVYWDMNLKKRVGTPSAPADPALVPQRAARLFEHAAEVSGCATPLIGINELFGAQLRPPLSATNRTYRANVLTLLRALRERGARPFLFVSHPPATSGEAAAWWRDVGAVSDVVRELYVPAPDIHRRGPAGGARYLRFLMRRAIRDFTSVGIPSTNVGLALGFHTTPGTGGRDGLQPAQAWFDVVKLEALAARRVATQLGAGSIWSWGWATWTRAESDPDKPVAACVYLWTRDNALCDGPGAAGNGFDASLRDGSDRARPRLRVQLFPVRGAVWIALKAAPALAGRVAFVQRRAAAEDEWVSATKVVLSPLGTMRRRVRLSAGRWELRVRVAAEPARGGQPFATRPRPVRVR